MPRPVCVEQHSEEDCGAAYSATVALQHGERLPLVRIRELVGPMLVAPPCWGCAEASMQWAFMPAPCAPSPI